MDKLTGAHWSVHTRIPRVSSSPSLSIVNVEPRK